MMHICKTYDADIFAKFKKDDNGLYFNQRVEDEINKRKNFTDSRKANRISKKTIISSTYEKHMSPHMENENENENENKDESKNEKKAKPKIEITIPWTSAKFIDYWETWKDYKSQDHKFKFKSAGSEQASLNELVKLSDGHEDVAIKIIMQSMAKGWKGFFELKTEKNGTAKTNQARSSHITDQQLHEAFAKRFGSR